MDVITTYLYGSMDNDIYMKIPGSMDNDIYMKIPEGFKLHEANTKPRNRCLIKLQLSIWIEAIQTHVVKSS